VGRVSGSSQDERAARIGRRARWVEARAAESSGALNWSILAGFLLVTTVIGHRLRGDASQMQKFFFGSRNMWWAVAASRGIVAGRGARGPECDPKTAWRLTGAT
jgi:hypothetical protein